MSYFCFAKLSGWKKGTILRRHEIKVGIDDLVLLRGYGIFDYLRTYYGNPFRLDDYLSRFANSAREMGMKIPLNKKEISAVIFSLLKKNHASASHEFGIRLLLTGGYSLDSFLPAREMNFFILVEDLPQYPAWYKRGIKLMLYEHKREIPSVKSINYLTAIRLAEARRRQKAQDTLYYFNGKLLETTRQNFFLFHGDTLVTAGENILYGITRKAVLELAEKKYTVQIRDVGKEELFSCTECFVTGTTRGITPVVRVDDILIGNGTPGTRTKELIALFEEMVKEKCL